MILVSCIVRPVVCIALFASIYSPINSFADNLTFRDRSYKSYVQFIEGNVLYYESIDGFTPGSYGEINGELSVAEVCNVGGQLVHDVPGFAQWTFQLYKQGELSPMGYSIVIGGATISHFEYQETLRAIKGKWQGTTGDNSSGEISFSNANIENLLGHYR